jgi:hypothetical protein
MSALAAISGHLQITRAFCRSVQANARIFSTAKQIPNNYGLHQLSCLSHCYMQAIDNTSLKGYKEINHAGSFRLEFVFLL